MNTEQQLQQAQLKMAKKIYQVRIDLMREALNKMELHPPGTDHYCPTDMIMLESQIENIKGEIQFINKHRQ